LPIITTADFGTLSYDPQNVYEFADGLPAFETEKEFVLVQRPDLDPLIFLQSARTGPLRFPCLPLLRLCPEYRFELQPAERELLGLDNSQHELPPDLIVLGMVTAHPNGPATLNLLAPVILWPVTRRGLQSIQAGKGYALELSLAEISSSPGAPCS
jgi:flagellar assembly factor FliW